ncbi:MAG: hypothetical protein LBI15_07195 [Dysgonamonadaceae bacterium]|jgi:hypothetical protein|nr:hypothetical protein [Dysgonamonadaceae bacterium]
MRTIYKIGTLALTVLMTASLWSCADVNEEFVFVHDTNTIEAMFLSASHAGSAFTGEIHEFNKAGELIKGAFTQQEVEGGYGLIIFRIPRSLENDINLSNVYLRANVTFTVFIAPGLSGRHDITGDGIIITVTSGVGTTRQYRVRGVYE